MNYKVYVKDEETSKKVQEHAFKLGYEWGGMPKVPQFLNCPFLFFNEERVTKYISYVDERNFKYFNGHENKELTSAEFLALPVPDPETYCPRCKTKLKLSTIKEFGRCPACHITFIVKEERIENFDVNSMTELKAHEIARDMWKFLSENPDKKKSDWEYFNTYKLCQLRGECTLCKLYNDRNIETECKGCCLKEKGVCDNITGRNYMSWTRGVCKKENASIIYEVLKVKCDQLNPENKFDVDSMTEIEAVTLARGLWEFLKDNPSKGKQYWELYPKYKIEQMKSRCPLCHFYKDCNKCFLHDDIAFMSRNLSTGCCLDYHHWSDARNCGSWGETRYYATRIFNTIDKKLDELRAYSWVKEEKEKTESCFKYTHEQIMTGWFRVPSRNDVGSWFRVWVFNPDEKKYGVTADRTVRYKREEFNDWEYSKLPPE